MTPIEALDFAVKVDEAVQYKSWLDACYQRVDKFPKKPEDLFKKAKSDMGDVLVQAQMFKRVQDAQERLKNKPKARRRQAIMREE